MYIQLKDVACINCIKQFIAGLPRARSARGTEPHTHGIWSTSFRLVVTWLTERTYVRVYRLYGLMYQLIEVTWFIWKLSADQLIVLLDREQCSIILFSYLGIGAQENWYTYRTSMLWSIDSCQNKVSTDQYHLSESRAQVSTHRGDVFFLSYPLTRYWFSNDRRLKFFFVLKKSYEICCVYVPHK